MELPPELIWDEDRLSAYDWLRPLLSVPDNASPPLLMTAPHLEAVGSYGAQAIAWIEQARGITLRWWQRLATVRQLEHRADGSLVWRTVVESASRRSGKSERLRSLALWRMEHGEMFEPDQVVVHIGRDVAICREVQERAWTWCEDQGWRVQRGNGKEKIEHPNGARWLVKAKHAVYGMDGHLIIADECWDLEPSAISDGAEPAMLERESPQLILTSTAHPFPTSLMPTKITAAMTGEDPGVLLLLWGARPGADLDDPLTWRQASPHWTPERFRMIAAKRTEAMDKEPTVDDLDPVRSWECQYLNSWRPAKAKAVPGSCVVSEPSWATLLLPLPSEPPEAVAVEGWPGEGLSVARAWRQGETVLVATEDVPDLGSAAALVRSWRCRRPVVVGSSLATDRAWSGMRVKSSTGAVRTVVADLARLLTDGVIRHVGGDTLTSQVLALRTSPGADGLRIRSVGRADAVKAAVWAAQALRTSPAVGRPRIIVAA